MNIFACEISKISRDVATGLPHWGGCTLPRPLRAAVRKTLFRIIIDFIQKPKLNQVLHVYTPQSNIMLWPLFTVVCWLYEALYKTDAGLIHCLYCWVSGALWQIQDLAKGGGPRRAYNRIPGAEPPLEVRGKAPLSWKPLAIFIQKWDQKLRI